MTTTSHSISIARRSANLSRQRQRGSFFRSQINKKQIGKAQLSFLRFEPYATLFCLAALYLPPSDPARWPGIAPPWCRQHVLLLYCCRYTAGEGFFNSERSRTTLPIQVLLIFVSDKINTGTAVLLFPSYIQVGGSCAGRGTAEQSADVSLHDGDLPPCRWRPDARNWRKAQLCQLVKCKSF